MHYYLGYQQTLLTVENRKRAQSCPKCDLAVKAPRASNGGRQLVRPSVKVLQFASEGQKVKRTSILTS